MAGAPDVEIRDAPGRSRYELVVDGEVAGQIVYRERGDALVMVHTDVAPELEGRGLGARLVSGALDDVRARGLKIVPLCPFVRSYVERHPEYAELVAADGR